MTNRKAVLGMKYFADPLAVAIIFGATLLIIGASTEPAPIKLPEFGTSKVAAKPEAPRPSASISFEQRSTGTCRAAAWPHLPTDCVAQASADREIRVVR